MKAINRALVACALIVLCSGLAKADLTVTQSMVIDSPKMAAMMANMPAAVKQQMQSMGMGGGAMSVVTYYNGKMIRSDVGTTMSSIIDSTGSQMTTLNPSSKTYWTMPFDPTKAAANATVSVKDAGDSKSILGHTCEHYTISFTSAGQQGPPTTITGDIWATTDFAQPTFMGLGRGPMAQMQAAWKSIKGLPLLTVMHMSNQFMGDATMTSTVTAISQDPIPDSKFQVPADYTKSSGPTFGGFGGGPPPPG